MSAILLTAPHGILENIQKRDTSATRLPDKSAVFAKKEAIICSETYNFITQDKPPRDRVEKTTTLLSNGWMLRIVHDTRFFSQPKFLNIQHGDYYAPWGIWILHCDDKVTLSEAVQAYNHAKTYTYLYSPNNQTRAKSLNYV